MVNAVLWCVTPLMMCSTRALSLAHCCSSGLVSVESDLKRFRMSFLGIAKKQNKQKTQHQQQQQQRTVTLILYRLTCYAHHISATVASALCATWAGRIQSGCRCRWQTCGDYFFKSTNLRCSTQPAIVFFPSSLFVSVAVFWSISTLPNCHLTALAPKEQTGTVSDWPVNTVEKDMPKSRMSFSQS